jgi:hypothetical protein
MFESYKNNTYIYIYIRKQKPLETSSYALDLDGMRCKKNSETCPVVPVVVPRLEKAKCMSLVLIFEMFNINIFGICSHI